MVNISGIKGKTIKGFEVKDSIDFTNLILEKGNVAIVPGIAFGDDDYVRLSYANSLDNIKEGLNRIKDVIEG
jgi:aspartate aminotransferase